MLYLICIIPLLLGTITYPFLYLAHYIKNESFISYKTYIKEGFIILTK